MMSNKPFYSLRVISRNNGFYLCINGAYVEVHESDESLDIEYPINQWLKNGANTLELYQYIVHDPETGTSIYRRDAAIEVQLLVKEAGTEDKTIINSLCFKGAALPRIDGGNKVDYARLAPNEICKGSTPSGQYTIDNMTTRRDDSGAITIGSIHMEKGAHNGLLVQQNIDLPLPLPEWQFFSADKHPG